MLTLEQCRKIDPATASLSDEELLQLRDDYAEIAQLAFESWMEERSGSKNHVKVLSNSNHSV